jgi:hypothetical protein
LRREIIRLGKDARFGFGGGVPGDKAKMNDGVNYLLHWGLAGGADAYPAATPKERRQIWETHRAYTHRLLWFLRTDAAVPAPTNRIVLIDRPQSPQSLIYGGAVLPLSGTDDLLTLNAANTILGTDFLSRINSDLRETRGWSYGVRGGPNALEQRVPYIVNAPVQANRTGESIAALIAQYERFLTEEGVTPEELVAWQMVDEDVAYVSPSSVYRILNDADLLYRWKRGRSIGEPPPPTSA